MTEVLTLYKTCPCWSIIPGKSSNCERYCPIVQRNKCTNDFNKDKKEKENKNDTNKTKRIRD